MCICKYLCFNSDNGNNKNKDNLLIIYCVRYFLFLILMCYFLVFKDYFF